MAVLLQLLVTSATRDQFDKLDAKVGQAMSDGGGPPPGHMSHVVYPEGDGFVVAEVWRTESEGQLHVDDVLRLLLSELRLTASEAAVLPVWSFARPRRVRLAASEESVHRHERADRSPMSLRFRMPVGSSGRVGAG